SRRGGSYALWRVSLVGEKPQWIPVPGDNLLGPTVSRQGSRLAFTRRSDDRNIWRLELPGPGLPARAAPVQLIASTRDETLPQFSPDGKRIAFGSDRSGNSEIWRCERDGSNPVPLTSFGG